MAQSIPLKSNSVPDRPGRELAAATDDSLPSVPNTKLPVVRTVIQVTASPDEVPIEHSAPLPFHATAAEILPSAGTYGDFTRYLQNSPGVVANGDWSDDLIIRGGNPIENLFLVDGFEVPNINQVVTEDTTGGLFAMIDTSAIQSVDLYTGGYDASYDERLSSVVDIHSREFKDRERHGEATLGYIGAGGLAILPIGQHGSIFAAAHRSILNLISNNIGLGGTPVYSNMLIRAEFRPRPTDDLTFLSLSGWDSIDMMPGGPGNDCIGTNDINMQYSGWRTTSGLRWRHAYTPHALGILSGSDSEQVERIQQEDNFWKIVSVKPDTQPTPVTVYRQFSHDGQADLKYDFISQPGQKWSLMTGLSGYLRHLHYDIEQPVGEQSPLSTNPTSTDSDSFWPDFLTGATGWYAEVRYRPLTRWSISAGGRLQTFALGGHSTATPRLNTALRLTEHTGLHAAFGEYAQMPPAADVTSWPQNHRLLPIRVRHIIAGADLYTGSHVRFGIEAYQKNYRDYAVSNEYPSLSLANMVDELGHEILWIPLVSKGTGISRGLEMSTSAHLGAHLTGQANLTYAHAEYAGTDGVLRPGNFDYRVVGNTAGTYRSGRHYEVSWRYECTTGKPYTPFLVEQTVRQNRPIYDMTKINAARGPLYSRLDLEADRSFFIGSHRLIAYVGIDNAFNHKNFEQYELMPRVNAYWGCGQNLQNCFTEVDGFSRFPDGGVRYSF